MDGRIALLITKAEHHIEQQRYKEAEECVAAAEHIDPMNRSVRMLRELLSTLQKNDRRKSALLRFFPRTLRKPSVAARAPLSSAEISKRVRSLVSSADHYLSRGAIENAFDALTRAQVLDPSHPDVIACEKRVMPCWRKLRGSELDASATTLPLSNNNIQSPLFERLKKGTLLA
jgi:predicted Zn-dependent protease